MEISSILARTSSAIMKADEVLTQLSEATLAQQNDNTHSVQATFIDIVTDDDDTLSNNSQVPSAYHCLCFVFLSLHHFVFITATFNPYAS